MLAIFITCPYCRKCNFKIPDNEPGRSDPGRPFHNYFHQMDCKRNDYATRFKEETGYQVSKKENWDESAYRACVQYRHRTI